MTRRFPFFVVLVLGLVGCGPGYHLENPTDFLRFDRYNDASHGYEFRARNADGVALALRVIENRGEGSLGFWRDALRNQLTVGLGYALLEETEARAASGEVGVRFVCGRDQGGVSYGYSLTLFVADERVFVLEAGGVREAFDRARPAIDATVADFRIE